MTTPAKITDFEERVVASLPYPVQAPPLIAGLAETLGDPGVQDAENDVWELLDKVDPKSATGNLLDIIGKLFGVLRAGLSDALFGPMVDMMSRSRWSHGGIGSLAALIWAAAADEDRLYYIHSQTAPCDCVYVAETTAGDTMTPEYQAALQSAVIAGAPAGTGVTVLDRYADGCIFDGVTSFNDATHWARCVVSSYRE